MHDNFMKKSPYQNTDRTSMKKYHNFMKEKPISKHGENFHKKKALTTYCSNCGQLIEHDYPPY